VLRGICPEIPAGGPSASEDNPKRDLHDVFCIASVLSRSKVIHASEKWPGPPSTSFGQGLVHIYHLEGQGLLASPGASQAQRRARSSPEGSRPRSLVSRFR
jgi:hypothetical protein